MTALLPCPEPNPGFMACRAVPAPPGRLEMRHGNEQIRCDGRIRPRWLCWPPRPNRDTDQTPQVVAEAAADRRRGTAVDRGDRGLRQLLLADGPVFGLDR